MKHIKLFEQFTTEKQLEFDFDRNSETDTPTMDDTSTRELGTMGFPTTHTFIFESPIYIREDIEAYAENAMQWGDPNQFMQAMGEIGYEAEFEWQYKQFQDEEITDDEFFDDVWSEIQSMSRQSSNRPQPLQYTSIDPADIADEMIEDFNETDLVQFCEIPGVESIKAVEVTEDGMFRVEVNATSDLSVEEMKEWLSGQYSDGWGEGFEQNPIKVGKLDVYVSTWSSSEFGDARDFTIELVNP
jgi:hypothetical protein